MVDLRAQVGAEPREQRRLKELYRRASNELRQRHVAAVALENKAIDIRKRQKRRKELKPQLTDLFSARRGVPPELIQNILTFVGYDLVQAEVPAYDLMRDDPRAAAQDTLISVAFAAPDVAMVVLKVGHPPMLWTDVLTCAIVGGKWWIVAKSSCSEPLLKDEARTV